jgi:hypothetical protein
MEEPPLYTPTFRGGSKPAVVQPSQHIAALPSRCKNPNRPAEQQFTEPVQLCYYDGRTGHYERGMFWGAMDKNPQAVAPEKLEFVLPLRSSSELAIPTGMIAACKNDGAALEFYDFGGVHKNGRLHVAATHAAGIQAVLTRMGLCAEVVPLPCDASPTVEVKATFTVLGLGRHLERVAHCLAATGLGVSLDVAPGAKHPTTRVQASALKWVKDCELAGTMSKYADSAMADDGSKAVALSWAGVVYDEDMSVARTMMSWGALAAWTARNWFAGGDSIPPPAFEEVCEPLASYVRALFGVNSARAGAEVATLSDVSLCFNSPAKMTAAQVAHANALFYWCAVHKDEDTLAVPRHVAKEILEMYLRFGHVVLRKRAYQFHKKRSLAEAFTDSEE